MNQLERLADVRCVADKLKRLPVNALWYVLGYTNGAADASEQSRSGERREGA